FSCGQGHVLGAIALYRRRPGGPNRSDLALLETASKLAAVAVAHDRLFDQAARGETFGTLARLKSEFLGTASHELRMPLSLIYGYAELLLERAPVLSADEVAQMASEIHTSAGTMIRLVDDLLDLSRIEHDRIQFHRRRVRVAEALGALLEIVRHQAGGERIRAELPAELEATLDPERLVQIVGNLLSNALRYAPEGP